MPDEYWVLPLDYPIRPRPRYGYDRPAHPQLHEILSRDQGRYRAVLDRVLGYRAELGRIPVAAPPSPAEAYWQAGWLPGLDLATLYVMVRELRPARYVEVGSGASTKFVRRAIRDGKLSTEVISIDPEPRAEIDSICDRVVRAPLEEADLSVFETLGANDLVFVDNSHRCFMNSDVTVVFLDVLPRLAPGVHVGFHDICLPWDYPAEYADRFYSEQYLLAVALLAEGTHLEVVLPNWFVSHHPELAAVVQPLWEEPGLGDVERHGSAFFLRIARGSRR